MTPKFITLATRLISDVTASIGTVVHLRGSGGVDILVPQEGLQQTRVPGEVRQDSKLYLGVVDGQEGSTPGARSATKALRTCLPSSVRTGMFCRLGSLLDMRPVADPVWL